MSLRPAPRQLIDVSDQTTVSHADRLLALKSYTPKSDNEAAQLHRLAKDTEVKREFDDFEAGQSEEKMKYLEQQMWEAMRLAQAEQQSKDPAQNTSPFAQAPPRQLLPSYAPAQSGGPGAPKPGEPGSFFGPPPPPPDPRDVWVKERLQEMTPEQQMAYYRIGPRPEEEKYLAKRGKQEPWQEEIAKVTFRELPKYEQDQYTGGWLEWLERHPMPEDPTPGLVIPQPRGPRFGPVDAGSGKEDADGKAEAKYFQKNPTLPGYLPPAQPDSFKDVWSLLCVEMFPDTPRMHWNYPVIYKPPTVEGKPAEYIAYPLFKAMKAVLEFAPRVLNEPKAVFIRDLADLLDNGVSNAGLTGWQFERLRGIRAAQPAAAAAASASPFVDEDEDKKKKKKKEEENTRSFNPNRTRLLIMAVILIEKLDLLYSNRFCQDRFFGIFGTTETRDQRVRRLRQAYKLQPGSDMRAKAMKVPTAEAWTKYKEVSYKLGKLATRCRKLIIRWELDNSKLGTDIGDDSRDDHLLVLKVRRGPKYLAITPDEWKAWFFVEIRPAPPDLPNGWASVFGPNPVAHISPPVLPGQKFPDQPATGETVGDLQLGGGNAVAGEYEDAKQSDKERQEQMEDVENDRGANDALFGDNGIDYHRDEVDDPGQEYENEGAQDGDDPEVNDGEELPGLGDADY